MTKIKGKDVILYVYVDSTPVPAICATNVSMDVSSGQISTLTFGGGKHRTYKGTARDATIVLDGVMTLDETGSFQKDDWLDNIGEILPIKITYTDGTNTMTYDMNVLVTGVTDSNEASGFSTFSISMLRSGPWYRTPPFAGGGGGVAPFTAYWEWFTVSPLATLLVGDPFVYTHSGTFADGASLSLNITGAPAARYHVIKVPSDQPIKTAWFNTAFNNGTVPDSVFRASFVTGSFRYYVTRVAASFDTTQPLILS